jgi:hypothetical protein
MRSALTTQLQQRSAAGSARPPAALQKDKGTADQKEAGAAGATVTCTG